MSNALSRFSHSYRELVYSIWYTRGKPSANELYSIIDNAEDGRKPSPDTLNNWKNGFSWNVRADTADMELSKQTDRELVKIRMKMMKRHSEIAQDVAERAYQHLVDVGFDSSTSAVNALFKAVEEEKRSRGMEVALAQVFSLNDEDLQKTMNRLLSRASGLGVDDENIITVEEESDAVSTEETS